MNDLRILELVARWPGIKASAIAEALKTPLVDVSASLRCLVDVGDLSRAPVFDDNGRQAQAYTITDQWLKSPDGKAWASGGATTAPTAAPTAASLPIPTFCPTEAPAAGPKVSKVDLAIALIRKNGSATVDQLREAMGLGAFKYPSGYLVTAEHDGRLVRDGMVWKLGPKLAATDNVEVVGNLILATKDHQPVPRAAMDAVQEVAQPQVAIAKPEVTTPAPLSKDELQVARTLRQEVSTLKAATRCAIWSDGTYEVMTGGVTVATLTHDEVAALMVFVERVGAAA